jgi:hypothetical protein
VRELLTRNLDIPGLVLPDNLGYDPPPTMLAALAERTGVTVARMRTTTLAGWMPWLLDDLGATVDLREHWKAPKGLTSLFNEEHKYGAELTRPASSSWDVRTVDERVLSDLRHHCPGAKDL